MPAIFFSLPGAVPTAIAVGSDGNLWVTDDNNSGIWRVTPTGVKTFFPVPSQSSQQACLGPDGNVWFTNIFSGVSGVYQVQPNGIATLFDLSSVTSAANGICTGPDGNLWISCGDGVIIQVSPLGAILNSYSSIGSALAIVTGPDGNLWSTGYFGGPGDGVAQTTPLGIVTQFPIDPLAALGSICVGPDGNLWSSDFITGNVWKIPVPPGIATLYIVTTPGLGLESICTGSDGNLWISDGFGVGVIVRMTTSGVSTVFPLPNFNAGGFTSIINGPDNNLWVTDNSNKGVWRIDPLDPTTVSTVDITVGQAILLNGIELLGSMSSFPQVPSSLPLQWDCNDHTVAEFFENNADRTQVRLKGLKLGSVVISVTDGLLPQAYLQVNVLAIPVVIPIASVIQIMPLPVSSGDPFGE